MICDTTPRQKDASAVDLWIRLVMMTKQIIGSDQRQEKSRASFFHLGALECKIGICRTWERIHLLLSLAPPPRRSRLAIRNARLRPRPSLKIVNLMGLIRTPRNLRQGGREPKWCKKGSRSLFGEAILKPIFISSRRRINGHDISILIGNASH